MASVILARAGAVELLVVELCQPCAPVRVLPDPVGKRFLDKLLLSLRDCGFLLVEDRRLASVLVFDIVEDADVAEVQRFLDDLVTVDAARAVGAVDFDVASVVRFALDAPVAGIGGKMRRDIPALPPCRIHQIPHKLIDVIHGKPGRAESDRDLTCREVFRHDLFKRLYVDIVVIRVKLCAPFRPLELFADISGQVFVGGNVLFSVPVSVSEKRV